MAQNQSAKVFTFAKLFFAFLLVIAITPVSSAMAQTELPCDYYGMHADGAIYCIVVPADWNGDLVVYAHGYVRPSEPVGIPEDQMVLPGLGLSVPT